MIGQGHYGLWDIEFQLWRYITEKVIILLLLAVHPQWGIFQHTALTTLTAWGAGLLTFGYIVLVIAFEHVVSEGLI